MNTNRRSLFARIFAGIAALVAGKAVAKPMPAPCQPDPDLPKEPNKPYMECTAEDFKRWESDEYRRNG